jgi:hypothetical protein
MYSPINIGPSKIEDLMKIFIINQGFEKDSKKNTEYKDFVRNPHCVETNKGL